jgi:RND family efflux transporter MFP subunit
LTSRRPIAVTAFTVAAREIPLVIKATGRTEAADRYEAKAPADIKVQKIFVEEGVRVEAGDPLVRFDDEEVRLKLAKARAELREAEAALDLNNFQQQNRERLIAEEKMSEEEAELLERKIAYYEATVERAKAEIELYEKSGELEQLNSPIAGTVVKRTVSEGADVAEDTPLLEVVRLDPIRFVFAVPVEAVTALDRGAEIAVRFPSIGGQEFSGEIANVGALANAEAGGVEVKLNLANPDLFLKAELPGEVVIRTQGRKKVLPVVESALVKTEKSTYVYKIEGSRVRRVAVELGEPYNGQPTIEKGVNEGDLIVSSAEEELKDGMVVEVQTTRAEG